MLIKEQDYFLFLKSAVIYIQDLERKIVLEKGNFKMGLQ